MTLFFLADPGGQGLLDDPGARAIQLCSQFVNLLGQWQRHMGSQHFCIHRDTPIQSKSILVI
jgi:hypothetical protein